MPQMTQCTKSLTLGRSSTVTFAASGKTVAAGWGSCLLCAALLVLVSAWASPAKAASIMQEVLNPGGSGLKVQTETEANPYVVTTGGKNYNSGPGNTIPNLIGVSFSIQGAEVQNDNPAPFTSANFGDSFNYPATMNGLPVTAISDTLTAFGYDPGTFSMTLTDNHGVLTGTLAEQIDLAYTSGHETTPSMTTIFNSTTLLGFGAVTDANNNPIAGEYWYAFEQTTVGTKYSGSDEIIGGIIQANADIKTFSLAPTPTPASSALVLMLGMVGWRLWRRFDFRGGIRGVQSLD
jgi:hypothetical protein